MMPGLGEDFEKFIKESKKEDVIDNSSDLKEAEGKQSDKEKKKGNNDKGESRKDKVKKAGKKDDKKDQNKPKSLAQVDDDQAKVSIKAPETS